MLDRHIVMTLHETTEKKEQMTGEIMKKKSGCLESPGMAIQQCEDVP